VLCLNLNSAFAQFNFAPPDSSNTTDTLTLWATEYYVHKMRSGGNIPFLKANGDTLGYYGDTCDFCTACLEGTAFVLDSTDQLVVLNYEAVADTALVNCRRCPKFKPSSLNVESWGRVRWKISSGYGEGVNGYLLVPYRTIAVDSTVIPYGSIVYIPEADGTTITLPNGTTIEHDGYFFAGDTGGAIRRNHIDVFTGTDASHPFQFVHSNARQTFTAFIIDNQEVKTNLTQLHMNE
jgi:3D (Asp-Asp-Asp) domain-containing protein